ncbi:MAG: Ig-like domain-containing protein, partial [Acidimicrobiia bacterium]|nr:Ig-like domain-containing protein [Acidimicrobiia bacterium]
MERPFALFAALTIALGNLTLVAPVAFAAGTIGGMVFEDIAGNVLDGGEAVGDANNPGRDGVNVYLYPDLGLPQPELGDGPVIGPVLTAGGGLYNFGSQPDGAYWVVVDSQGLGPNTRWAEQTYGPTGAWCADGLGATAPAAPAAGPCYGGRRGNQSDALATWYTDAEHIARVVVAGGNVTAHFGFSFNAVTTTRGGGAAADPGAGGTQTVQGSLRQFITNATNIAGANAMRFVPAEPANDGSGLWWRIVVSSALPTVSGASTTIDGTAYQLADGVTVRDQNPGYLGANAGGGMKVGAGAGVSLPRVEKPELEVQGSAVANGIELLANSTEVRDVAIHDFTNHTIKVGPSGGADYTGIVVADNVVGTGAGAFSGSLPASALVGVYVEDADGARIDDNLVGWYDTRTVDVLESVNVVVHGNELRSTDSDDVMDVYLTSDSTTVEENFIHDGDNWGIDLIGPNSTARSNTIQSIGDGVGQTGGIRFFSAGQWADLNLITTNGGPGIAVGGDKTTAEVRPRGEVLITGNEYGTNDGLAIDVQAASDDNTLSGDGITLNDGATTATSGNLAVDFPVIDNAYITGANLTVTGYARPSAQIEFYEAVGAANDQNTGGTAHGEGITWLFNATEGVSDGDPTVSTSYADPDYGSDANVSRFSFTVTKPAALVAGEQISATGSDGSNTSEFGPNFTVFAAAEISGVVFEDLAGDGLPAAQVAGDAANPFLENVDVYLYDNNGIARTPDASDSFVAATTTAADGSYAFIGLAEDDFIVFVDSKTVEPTAGYNGVFGPTDVWAEQSYGPGGRIRNEGGPWIESNPAGPLAGGARANVSDDASSILTAEHLAYFDTTGPVSFTGANWGFSYNVVSATAGGDAADHDGGGTTRTVQGSLRQFIQNANAIVGWNFMWFAPREQPNATDGGGNDWWKIDLTVAFPVVNDAETRIDGTAWNFITHLFSESSENTALQGAGEVVGVDGLFTSAVLDPELEIDVTGVTDGIVVDASNSRIKALSVWGSDSYDIRIGDDAGGDVVGVKIEQNIIGNPPHQFNGTVPPIGIDQLKINNEAKGGTVSENLMGFGDGSAISIDDLATGWTVLQNEIRGVGRAAGWGPLQDAINDVPSGTIVRGNLLVDSAGFGVDSYGSTGGFTIDQNTLRNNGTVSPEVGGVRLMGSTGSTVSKNIFEQNNGPAIIVVGDRPSAPYGPSEKNHITQNEFSNLVGTDDNLGIAIDLIADLATDAEHDAGDGVTNNDGGLDGNAGNNELDFPVIDGAYLAAGNLTVTGFARPDVVIEFYRAKGATNDNNGGGNPHGEGFEYLDTRTEGVSDGDATTGATYPDVGYGTDASANRFSFTFAAPTVSVGDEISPIAYLAADGTSEFGPNLAVTTGSSAISGTVFEDVAGNVLDGGEAIGDGNNPTVNGVNVWLYNDNGGTANAPDPTDTVRAGPVATAGLGAYSFGSLADGTYWVVVDSGTVAPSAGYNGTFALTDVWSEQTYGPTGGWCADGLGGTAEAGSAGACFGGVDGAAADNAAALTSAEHVVRVVIVGGAPVGNVDFGFSFNVVTNADASTAATTTGRTAQGSLDQFIRNADAVAGDNSMRFVPAVPANDGTSTWWRIDYAAAVNPLRAINDAGTEVDGTAFQLANGVIVRDLNGGFLGANALGGLATGTDDVLLPQVAKPELEIKDATLSVAIAGALVPDRTEIYDLSVWGAANSIDVDTGTIDNIRIERNVVGSAPGSFADPGGIGDYGIQANSSASVPANAGIIAGNLIGFLDNSGIHLEAAGSGWSITGNEVTATGQVSTTYDAILLWDGQQTVTGNYVHTNNSIGLDTFYDGGHLIENNTYTNNGNAGLQTAGIRLQVDGSTVRRNIITNNTGPGIIVAQRIPDSANLNLITENSFSGNGGLGIDLIIAGGNANTGDDVNPNDAATDPTTGNIGLDHPVLTEASLVAGTLTITGTTPATTTLELYVVAADPTGYGEGQDYVVTPWALLEGGANDTDLAAGSFEFTFATAAVAAADELTAIAIDSSNNTSEFGPNLDVNVPPVADAIADKTVDELTLLSFTATETDADTADTHLWSLDSGPGGVTGAGVYSWTPAEVDGPGTFTVTLRVTDNGAPNLSDTVSFDITVDEVNTPPSVTNPGDQTNDEADVVSLVIAASDTDIPANVLTFSATGLPPGLWINAVTGEIQGTLSYTASGIYAVTVTATDDGIPSLDGSTVFTWTVNDVPLPDVPLDITKTSDGGGFVNVGDTIKYTIIAVNTATVFQTNFTVIDDLPTGTTYVPGSTEVTAPVSSFVHHRDEFNTQAYNGSDALPWVTDWQEVGEADGPSAGAWQVLQDGAFPTYGLMKTDEKNKGVQRVADLSGYAAANITFNYRREGMIPANDIHLQVSPTGVGGPWTSLLVISGGPGGVTDAAYQASPVVDLSPYMTATTAIRFYHQGANDFGSGRAVWFDDIDITGVVRTDATNPGSAPSTLATGYDLYPGEFMTVTFEVTVNAPPSVTQVDNEASVTSDDETTPELSGTITDVIVNRNPNAVDDSDSMIEDGSPLTIDVLANDTDPDSQPVGIQSHDVASANGGTISLDDKGTPLDTTDDELVYTPPLNFNGTDTFDYVAEDDWTPAGTNTATVTITVSAINDEPSFSLPALPDRTVLEDALPFSEAGFASSIIPGPPDEVAEPQVVTFTVTNDDNSLFLVQPDIDEATGTLTFTVAPNANGTATVSVYLTDDGVAAPAPNDNVSPTVTFDITITPQNDDPVAVDDGYGVAEGASFSTTAGTDGVADNDTDAEDGTPPGGDVTLVAGPSYHVGVFTLATDGSFTYTHDGTENFTDTFTYTVDDSDAATSNTATVTITITPQNDDPVAVDDGYGVAEGASFSTTAGTDGVADNDTDAE